MWSFVLKALASIPLKFIVKVWYGTSTALLLPVSAAYVMLWRQGSTPQLKTHTISVAVLSALAERTPNTAGSIAGQTVEFRPAESHRFHSEMMNGTPGVS